jgi:hypothetical protein
VLVSNSVPLPQICIPNSRCSLDEHSSNISTAYQTSKLTPSDLFVIISAFDFLDTSSEELV